MNKSNTLLHLHLLIKIEVICGSYLLILSLLCLPKQNNADTKGGCIPKLTGIKLILKKWKIHHASSYPEKPWNSYNSFIQQV